MNPSHTELETVLDPVADIQWQSITTYDADGLIISVEID